MKTKLFSACVVLLMIATAACKQAPPAADTQNIASPQKTAATPAARMLTASTSMARITVTVTNDSSFGNTYEFYDNVAQTALPQQTIAAHGSSTLDLKSSQALTDG